MVKLRSICVSLLLAALLLSGTGCAAGNSPKTELTVLTIGTADSGGTMYPVGLALAGALGSENRKINIGASTGSEMNIRNILSGEIDLGLVTADAALAAVNSDDIEADGLRAIGAVYVSVSTWLAPERSGLTYVHELQGMRVGVGPEGSVTEESAQISLSTLGLADSGLTMENCSLENGARWLEEGEIDALHAFVGNPSAGLVNMAREFPCTLLRYTQEELEQIIGDGQLYSAAVIPAMSYNGQQEDVQTFGTTCILCVNADMDEEEVYALTQALWESRESLGESHRALKAMRGERFLWEGLPIPLHDGAAAFYQETCSDEIK